MFFYTVKCTFTAGPDQAKSISDRWLRWLDDEHIADVVAGGSLGAAVVKMDGHDFSFEIRYRFADRDAFDAYEKNHAPRLRALGRNEFPLELGLEYERTTGEVVQANGFTAQNVTEPSS